MFSILVAIFNSAKKFPAVAMKNISFMYKINEIFSAIY